MSRSLERALLLIVGAVVATVGISGIPGARTAGPDHNVEKATSIVAIEKSPPAAPAKPTARQVDVKPIEPGNEPIQPVPSVSEFFEDYLEIDYEPKKIELGRMLFHDTRLSNDDTVSCATCHDLRFGGIDRSPVAVGVRGQTGPINTPTVFNAAFNVMQFWDGRAADLEAQANGPPNAPKEMDSNWEQINLKLLKDERIVELVKEAYAFDDVSADLDEKYWLDAIADFERTLITPGAAFDRYLAGDESAVSQEVKEGYQIFKDVGCVECHNGIAIGAKSFQKLGRRNPYFGAHSTEVDLGRFNVTGKDEDRHVFKVPTLRNVALTGPWFHDGTKTTLEEAVAAMAEYQIGKGLSDFEVSRIVRFLESLNGEYQGQTLGATNDR